MPVEFTGKAPSRLALPSSVPVELTSPAIRIAPVMMFDNPPASIDPQALVALKPGQRLVLVVGADAGDAGQVFPHDAIITVHRSVLPTEPCVAWESVDAIITDQPLPARLRDRFLAQGTTLLVHAADKPDSDLPWVHTASGWMVRAVAPDVLENASSIYEPMGSWHPSLSRTQRQVLLGLATLIALAALTMLLIRSRRSVLVQAGGFAAILIALAIWYRANPPMHGQLVRIDLHRDGLCQSDGWTYYKTKIVADVRSFDRPLIVDEAQAKRCNLIERISDDNDVQWQGRLGADQSLATVRRAILPNSGVPKFPERSANASMKAMARSVYARAGSDVRIGATHDEPPFTYIVVSDP